MPRNVRTPLPLPTAATRPTLRKPTRSVPVSACEGVAAAFQSNKVSTAHRIEDRGYLIMRQQLSRKIFARISRGIARQEIDTGQCLYVHASAYGLQRFGGFHSLWRRGIELVGDISGGNCRFGRFSDGDQRFAACAAAGDCDGQPAAWNGRDFLIYIKTIAPGTASLPDR